MKMQKFFASPLTDRSLNGTAPGGGGQTENFADVICEWPSKEERKAWLNGIYDWAAGQSNVLYLLPSVFAASPQEF